MRKTKDYIINISKMREMGDEVPAFIGVLHRHFQKGRPALASQREATLVAPLDLLELVVPARMLDPIDSIEIIYRKQNG